MTATPVAEAKPGLRLANEDGIGWISCHNPARLNALNAEMWGELPRLLATLEADPAIRVIVLRGSGDRAFSAGADISEFETARTGASASDYDALNHAAFAALEGANKPTIAMIHGFCLGGGLGIAACCDLRLTDDKAQFAIPAAKLGIGYNPRWVRPLLALAKPAHVKELLFTGRRFSATEALAMGLVNRVYTVSDLEHETRALAREIVGNAPLSIAAAKAAIDDLTRHPETADTTKLDALVARCFDSDDYAEGRRAFLEKRKPKFEGK